MALRKRLVSLVLLGLVTFAAASAPKAQEAEVQTAWSVVCNADDDCKASIMQPIDTGGEMEVWVGTTGENEYVGIILPLGIHIPSGVTLSFDRGKTAFAELNLVDCKPVGCRAVLGMTPELEAGMRVGNDVAIIARNSDTREYIGLVVTLRGFSKALDELRSR